MTVDLAAPQFWVIAVLAVLLLNAIVHRGARRAAFFAMNVVFLFLLLNKGVIFVLGGVGLFWAVNQLVARTRLWPAIVIATLSICLVIFALHKLPHTAAVLHASRLTPILLAVGYSYLMLRMIDVLRAVWERRSPPPGPLQLFNYLLPFHMLSAGPIQAWDDYVAQPDVPAAPSFDASLGNIELIVHGLFKKFVLAMVIERIFLTHGRAGGVYALAEMNLTAVWLYLDFSAYSDIAVGVGGLMGIATPINFNRPYLARNMTDYWERWHISLSQWIRRNLFFPMQLAFVRRTGGRYPLVCASIAIFVAFLLCGIWHGLSVPFFAWGVANASGLVIVNLYRYWLKKKLGSQGVARYMASWPIRILAIVITFEFVAFAIMLIASQWGEML